MALVTRPIRCEPFYDFKIRCVALRPDTEKLNCPFLKFLKESRASYPEELSKLTAVLDRVAQSGPLLANGNKFKKLHTPDGILQIRTTWLRLLCFYDEGKLIIVTHGFIKKGADTPKEELQTAKAWKKHYFETKDAKNLKHEPK